MIPFRVGVALDAAERTTGRGRVDGYTSASRMSDTRAVS
jgi:hypothetical protein